MTYPGRFIKLGSFQIETVTAEPCSLYEKLFTGFSRYCLFIYIESAMGYWKIITS